MHRQMLLSTRNCKPSNVTVSSELTLTFCLSQKHQLQAFKTGVIEQKQELLTQAFGDLSNSI